MNDAPQEQPIPPLQEADLKATIASMLGIDPATPEATIACLRQHLRVQLQRVRMLMENLKEWEKGLMRVLGEVPAKKGRKGRNEDHQK